MPDLPTFTVNNTVAQRLLSAFDGEVDYETQQPLTPTEAYKRWLKENLFLHVRDHERREITDTLDTDLTS